MVKVGIISANWGALAHLPAWRAVEGVEVTAICTSRRETAEAAAEKFGVARPFWSAAEMAADPDIDIIDIGTKPSLRHRMVLDAFAGGKHVYGGIPMAKDLSDARDMHAAWKAAGTVAVVDAYSQWTPPLAYAKELFDAGHCGTILGGSCRFNMALFNRPFRDFGYNWFWEGGLGVSSMRNNGSHLLHYLVSMLGPIAELVADNRLVVREWVFPDGGKLIPENPDQANVMLRFASGLVMPVQVCWTAPVAEGWTVDVWGTEGRLVTTSPIFPTSQDCKVFAGKTAPPGYHVAKLEEMPLPDRFKTAPGVSIDWTSPMPPAYPMALSMRAMVDAIEGKGTAAPDYEQAWQVERVQEAIRVSSLERRWVTIDEIG